MGRLNDTVAAAWSVRHRFFAPRARETVPESTPGQTQYIVVPSQTGGVRVTPETALQISAVWACISVISKDIASSVWQVMRELPNGDRESRRLSSLYRLLNVAPNPEMTAFEFREAILIAALLWSNGYAEIERDAGGRPIALWPLHPDRVTLERDTGGNLIYRVWNPVSPEVFLPARDVFHIHGPGIEGLVGFDITRLASTLFGHTLAAKNFGSAFYANGAHAGQVLETAANLNTEQMKELRGNVVESLRGNKQLGLFVATHGTKLTNQAIEPNKAQFIETLQYLTEDIARFFDVPPHKIGHLLRSTNNNIEEQGKDYVNKITPWAERLRQEAEKKLVLSRGIVTRIELEWLAEGNAKDKADADAILVNNGIQNRNEVRRKRGLNSIGPDGDKFTAQLNMTTLERIGEDKPEPIVPPALPAPDDGDGEDDEQPPSAALKLVERRAVAAVVDAKNRNPNLLR